MADNLSYTILNSDDPDTVSAGAPAYLLLMDSFLVDSDKDPQLLQSDATLYSAYSSIFVSEPARAIKMSNKALSYAEQALCITNTKLCHLREISFEAFSQKVELMNKDTIHSWFVFGSAWAGWIKANSGSMSAIAELPKVSLIMSRIIDFDDNWHDGQAHLYMGVLKTLLPPALGGKPEQGRYHFEKIIQLSDGKNLMAKVLYAEKYARLIFNQDLHDKLLQDVIKADPYFENLTLMNILAQHKAQKLLASSADYF
ncbi:MAG: TRAP transporter TatT component family protein [gamma proteobacterium symbiont of Bathyaustriella thionipta]|nr:TRAP transporter TatT component family protein [gamma proteobacterium symbiont of Bathyaustriella thionipta]